MQSRSLGLVPLALALGGAVACQSYSMEDVVPKTIVAVETSGEFFGAKPPVLLIVQDRSKSMDLCFGSDPAGAGESCELVPGGDRQPNRSRMDVAQAVLQDAIGAHETEAIYGLIAYGVGGETGCGDPATLVSPADGAASFVQEEYASNAYFEEPEGGTPTTKALGRALETLVDRTTGAIRPEFEGRAVYAVLVTDGLMNCNAAHAMPCRCSNDSGCPLDGGGEVELGEEGTFSLPEFCLDDSEAVSMVERLERAGVSTFVIGLGESFAGSGSVAVDVLDRLARAGGRPRQDEGGNVLSPAFYSAGDPEALQASITAILDSITAPCEYELPSPVCEGRLVAIKLEVDGQAVETTCGAADGDTWNFVGGDARRIRFNEPLCARMQNADRVLVTIKGIEQACATGEGATGPACDLSALP